MLIRLMTGLLVAAMLAGAATAKSRDPIRIVAGETAAQQVVAAIVQRALKKSGFKSETFPLERARLIAGLSDGTVHAHLSVVAAEHSGLADAVSAKTVRSLGGLAGNKQDEPVLKLVWPGMKKKWPYAQKMLKRMVLPAAEVSLLAAEAETGTPPSDVAAAWWKANRKSWKPWIAASKNWMKP